MNHIKAWLKAAYKSRTFWLGHIVAIFGIVQVALPDLRASLSPEVFGWLSLGVGLAIYALRAITTNSIHDK